MDASPSLRIAVAVVSVALAVGACRADDRSQSGRGDHGATPGPLASGDHRIEIAVGGRTRRYILHVPPETADGPRPLILELHGGGGRADRLEALTGLQAFTDPQGWLVALPEGLERSWNDGRPEVATDADDVAFLAAVIDDIAARTPTDSARVFAAGISNGAMMSGRLACDLAERLAGVAQVAGTLGVEADRACAPTRAVPVLVIAGTADPLVPYFGGEVGLSWARSRGTVMGADAYVTSWRVRNGLVGAAPVIVALPPDTSMTTWTRGPGAAAVVLYRVEGGGHTWPGGRQYLPAPIVGTTTTSFSASTVIVEFFDRVGGAGRDR